jgi:hypothetical protein
MNRLFSVTRVAVVFAGLIGASHTASAAGKFSAPVDNHFSLSFDSASATAPGPQSLLATGSSVSFDDSVAGERAFWGSFGGGPDSIVVDIVEDAGPNGTGDNATRLTVSDATPGGYFSGLIWAAKGLRLGNSSGATASGGEPIPDFDNGIRVTVPVKVTQQDARFRINFDSGSQVRAGRFDDGSANGGSFVQGHFPGLVDLLGPGSRILQLGNVSSQEIGSLPVNTWGTQTQVGGQPVALNEAPSTANGWVNASFDPFFSRAPRSFNLTRLGVTFPGSGGVGELMVGEWTIEGPDVLKYHHADFNTDEMVDAADIDLLTQAIRVLTTNEALPNVPDANLNGRLDFMPVFGVNRIPGLDLSFPEKFSITKTDNVLNNADVDELVLNVLGTSYGDLDLDGDVDGNDLDTLWSNKGQTGQFGWATGDINGDTLVDDSDFGVLLANLPGLAGDYNGDGSVDAADYTVWRDGGSPYNSAAGYAVWSVQYGASAPASFGVPEPSSLTLLTLFALSLVRLQRQG